MIPKMKTEGSERIGPRGLQPWPKVPALAPSGEFPLSAVPGEILNLDEASRYLRIKRRTLYSLAARGVVPGAKIGGQWRFRKSQLDGLFDGAKPPNYPALEDEVRR